MQRYRLQRDPEPGAPPARARPRARGPGPGPRNWRTSSAHFSFMNEAGARHNLFIYFTNRTRLAKRKDLIVVFLDLLVHVVVVGVMLRSAARAGVLIRRRQT